MNNAFTDFLNSLLGVYTPVADSSGIIPYGMAGVDWPYVFRAVLFCIVIYSLLRTLGGMLCKM